MRLNTFISLSTALLAPTLFASEQLNFVVIFSDELPPEYIGAYGQNRYPTPNLDRLAQDGMRFQNGYAVAPICTPARYSLQTGKYPTRCQATTFLGGINRPDAPVQITWNTRIESHEPTLARALVELGYNTGIAGKWHLADEPKPGEQSTHALTEIPEAGDLDSPDIQSALRRRQQDVQHIIKTTAGYTHANNVLLSNWEGEPRLNAAHNIPWITKGAVELLHEFAAEKKPFLLVTTPTSIHGPWHADALETDLRHTPDGYEADVYDYAPDYNALRATVAGYTSGEKHKHVGMVDLDHHVGRIRAELEALGLAQNTVIIYTADHGVEPGKASVYDRGLRVPFLVMWPGETTPGSVSQSLVQHPDITTSIAIAAGAAQAATSMDGVDIRPVLHRPVETVRDYAYFECGYSRGITDGRFKYISIRLPEWMIAKAEAGAFKWLTVGMGPGPGAHAAFAQLAYPDYYEPDQLYDLANDPYELHSIWNDPTYDAHQVRLAAALKRYTNDRPHPFPSLAQPFFSSPTYQALKTRTRAENNPFERETWVKRDHDTIPWPPVTSME